MVVVIGIPFARRIRTEITAGGLAVAIARAAAEAGALVQLIGKVGVGPDGDAVVLAVAEAGVGHAALLREPIPVPIAVDEDAGLDRSLDQVAGVADGEDPSPGGEAQDLASGSLDAADLALGLRYLPDYRVVVVADPLPGDALAAATEAARWAEARLVVVTAAGRELSGLPADATVLESPDEDAEAAFAMMVGRYAAALDAGAEPAEAFSSASAAAGWSAVGDDR
jgi:sugar/nucleoside kinase (ribokinase family)